MALSMDEQRMLAEIERRLAAENPGLATDLSSFRQPGRLGVLRSTRARVIGSLFTVAVVAMVSLVVYAMLPFRSGGRAAGHQPVTSTSTSSGQAKAGAAPGGSTKSGPAASSAAARPSARTSAAASATGASSSARASSAGVPSASAAYTYERDPGSG